MSTPPKDVAAPRLDLNITPPRPPGQTPGSFDFDAVPMIIKMQVSAVAAGDAFPALDEPSYPSYPFLMA